MKKKKICKRCGKEFKGTNGSKYCSPKCFNDYRKEYHKLLSREWRKSNKFDRTYRSKKDKEIQRKHFWNNKKIIYARVKLWSLNNKEKVLAQKLAQKIEIPIGEKCKKCKKRLARERHHEDYSKPYEIKFVCIPCHRKLNISRKKREGEI